MIELQSKVKLCLNELHDQVGQSVSGAAEELHYMELLDAVLKLHGKFSGLNRKVQLKPIKWKKKPGKEEGEEIQIVTKVEVVAKWGGELTPLGLELAETLGRRLRLSLYPEDPLGLVRLHSTFRHDFKVYSSLEGRCQATAAAFTKGFLDLEGEITPILVSLVGREEYTQSLLDQPMPKAHRSEVKTRIDKLLNATPESRGRVLTMDQRLAQMCPTGHLGIKRAIEAIGGAPEARLASIVELMKKWLDVLDAKITQVRTENHYEDDDDSQDGQDE